MNARMALAFAVSCAGCGSPSAPEADPVPLAPEVRPAATPASPWQDEQRIFVEEAVYRFQFANTRFLPTYLRTFCLARNPPSEWLPWTDAPESLVARFSNHQPAVKSFSYCRIQGDLTVVDVETGERAIVFRVAPPVWESDTEVVIDGGHHINGLAGKGETYRVRYEEDHWMVVDARGRWIS